MFHIGGAEGAGGAQVQDEAPIPACLFAWRAAVLESSRQPRHPMPELYPDPPNCELWGMGKLEVEVEKRAVRRQCMQRVMPARAVSNATV